MKPNQRNKKNETPRQQTPAKSKLQKETPKQSPESKSESPSSSKSPKVKKLANGLVIEDLVVGTGGQPTKGHNVSVKYVGRLTSGKVFDSSLNKPFSFRYGIGQVIQGWEQGLQGMREGGKRKLIIPPKLGYGSTKSGPIPANSTLEFEVELVKTK